MKNDRPVTDDGNYLVYIVGLRLMQENLRAIEEIKVRQEKLNGEALQLQQDMLDFRDEFQRQIKAVLERTPLTIRPRKTKVDLDEMDNVEEELLPPPMTPQVMAGASENWTILVIFGSFGINAKELVQSWIVRCVSSLALALSVGAPWSQVWSQKLHILHICP